MAPTASPMTPVKRGASWHPDLHDSPMSSFFGDDAYHHRDPASPSSTITEQLLERMDRLQSHLQHSPERDESISLVERKIGEIERELGALHSQTRFPAELEDSGLFMNDDDDDDYEDTAITEEDQRQDAANAVEEAARFKMMLEQVQAERDYMFAEMQRHVISLQRAGAELRQRLDEQRVSNARHAREIEEANIRMQLLQWGNDALKQENEALKTDLAYDHTELLFLKLQTKHMEMEISNDGEHAMETLKSGMLDCKVSRRTRRNRILAEMDCWHADWQEVDARFKRRRSRYGELYSYTFVQHDKASVLDRDVESQAEGEAKWELDAIQNKCGRVIALTISKRDGNHEEDEVDDNYDDGDDNDDQLEGETETGELGEDTGMSMPAFSDAGTQMETLFDITGNKVEAYDLEPVPQQTLKQSHRKHLEKTAWQELWEGLSNLSGMSNERF